MYGMKNISLLLCTLAHAWNPTQLEFVATNDDDSSQKLALAAELISTENIHCTHTLYIRACPYLATAIRTNFSKAF